MPIRQRRD
jgi:sulfoxide reductase catalytic subunit YedY